MGKLEDEQADDHLFAGHALLVERGPGQQASEIRVAKQRQRAGHAAQTAV